MSRKEALPFFAGIATAVGTAFGIGMMVWLISMSQTPEFDIMDHPRTQLIEGKSYMKDGILTTVMIVIRTKENLHAPHMEIAGREFIATVTAQHTSEQLDELSLKIKDDAIKYLGLPCTAQFVSVKMSPVK